MRVALRMGRKVDINYPDMLDYPTTVTVIGEVKVLPVEFEIAESGELVARRAHRLVKFYSDPGGFRTVQLAHLSVH